MSSMWDTLVDEDWLARIEEPVLDPDAAIVDPHHHLWPSPFRYETPELLGDMRSSHRVVGTVYAEAHRGYLDQGPAHLRPSGETAYMTQVADAAEALDPGIRLCAGIIGACDLTDDAGRVGELLDAHIAAGKGRFSGIRANVFISFHPASLDMFALSNWQSLADSPAFLAGARVMAAKDLVMDTVAAHFQLAEVARIAEQLPDLRIVLNHLSPPARLSGVANDEVLMSEWRHGIERVAACPNIHMKLGGCANPMMAHSLTAFRALRDCAAPPTSKDLAELYRPMVTHAIESFGSDRCMFESNFPVDKWATSYRLLWNAFKRLAQPYSTAEREDLLKGTATRVYRLENLPA